MIGGSVPKLLQEAGKTKEARDQIGEGLPTERLQGAVSAPKTNAAKKWCATALIGKYNECHNR